MARVGKFVKIREVLQGEIDKVSKKQEAAVAAEDYAMAAMYKGFRDTLNLLYEITNEKEGKAKDGNTAE